MKKRRLPLWNRVVASLVLLVGVAVLSGCGGGGSGASNATATVTNADPTGYYTNTGTLSLLSITDLQAMFYQGHVTLFSQAQGYGFAGTYSVSGNTINADLEVYTRLGGGTDTATFTATFNPTDHSITGTLTTKAGVMNAGFTLNYANGRAASTVAAIVKTGTNTDWNGTFMNETNDVLTVNITNNTKNAAITTVTKISDLFADYTDFDSCDFTGTFTPVIGSLYSVSIVLSGCTSAVDATYTGTAALNGSTLFVTATGSPVTNVFQGMFGVFN